MTEEGLIPVLAAACGFLGAWALVAGPVYQGAVELGEIKVDRSALMAQAATVPPPDRVSPWWWLLPPVAYVLTVRRQKPWQQRVWAALDPDQREQFLTFSNKATGWFVVGAGAALIALKETVELVEALEWPGLATVPLALLAAAAALAFTVRRMHRTEDALRGIGAPG